VNERKRIMFSSIERGEKMMNELEHLHEFYIQWS